MIRKTGLYLPMSRTLRGMSARTQSRGKRLFSAYRVRRRQRRTLSGVIEHPHFGHTVLRDAITGSRSIFCLRGIVTSLGLCRPAGTISHDKYNNRWRPATHLREPGRMETF